jgi:hypothetical protein
LIREPFVVTMKRKYNRVGETRSAAFGINLRVRHFLLMSGGASAAAGRFPFERLSPSDTLCTLEPRRADCWQSRSSAPYAAPFSPKNSTVKFLVS